MATRGDTAPLRERPDSDVIGIHLGGSSFCVSVWNAAQGWVRVLRAPSPSVVTYLGEREVVGDRERQVRSPKKSVTNCRWMLGSPYTELQTQLERWSCALLQDKQDRALLDVRSDGNRVSAKSCEQACAAILTEAKRAAQKAGSECSIVVITASPGFTEEQHRALEKSLSLAELSAEHIIPEQEAAALSYTLHPETAVVDRAETWLLFRVGGSSPFASVVQVSPAAYPEVLATRHDHTLGGALLTQRLVSLLPAQWRDTVPSTRLHAAVETAKIKLSSNESVIILHPEDDEEEVEVTREQLQDTCADLWWRWLQLLKKVMSEAKVTAEQIDKVILVGAASKTSDFKDMVDFIFPGKLCSMIIPPDEVFSHGAAIQAAILSEKLEIEREDTVAHDTITNETWIHKERRVLKSYMTTVLANKKKQQQDKLLVLCERAKENFCTSMELRVAEVQTSDQIATAVKEVLKYVLETFKKETTNCSRDVRKPFVEAIRQYSQFESQRLLTSFAEKDTSAKKDKAACESKIPSEIKSGMTSLAAKECSGGPGLTPEVSSSKTGADIAAVGSSKTEPLTGAALQQAKRLLESAKFNKDEESALHWAVREGHTDVVRLLLEQGMDFKAQDKKGWMPLHSAVYSGSIPVVKILVEEGCTVDIKTNNGYTPLHLAAHQGEVEILRVLVELGADVSVRSSAGRTPLHMAAEQGKVEAVRLLLQLGADVSVIDSNGDTPLHLAAKQGKVDTVRLLLQLGADVSVIDSDGYTPLHLAAHQGKVDILRVLVQLGADVSVIDSAGYTPLHLAAEQGKVETVRLLVQLGVDVNARTDKGETPLRIAACFGRVETVRLLVELGADVNVRCNHGNAPLDGAAAFGNVETVELLLNLGADMNNKDDDGDTALHETALHNKLDSARVLVKRGADINARNLAGKTPLTQARERGFTEVAEFLQSRGATV